MTTTGLDALRPWVLSPDVLMTEPWLHVQVLVTSGGLERTGGHGQQPLYYNQIAEVQAVARRCATTGAGVSVPVPVPGQGLLQRRAAATPSQAGGALPVHASLRVHHGGCVPTTPLPAPSPQASRFGLPNVEFAGEHRKGGLCACGRRLQGGGELAGTKGGTVCTAGAAQPCCGVCRCGWRRLNWARLMGTLSAPALRASAHPVRLSSGSLHPPPPLQCLGGGPPLGWAAAAEGTVCRSPAHPTPPHPYAFNPSLHHPRSRPPTLRYTLH